MKLNNSFKFNKTKARYLIFKLIMQLETSLNSMISWQMLLSKYISQISPNVVVSCPIMIIWGKEFSMNIVNMFMYSLVLFFLAYVAAHLFFTPCLRIFAVDLMTYGSFFGALSSFRKNCISNTLGVNMGDLLGIHFKVTSNSTFLGVYWGASLEIVISAFSILPFNDFGIDLPDGKSSYEIFKIYMHIQIEIEKWHVIFLY